MSRQWFVAALLIPLLPLSSRASTMRHDRNPSDYLSVGNFFSSVGRVDGTGINQNTGEPFSYIASGTLIAPNWVLTAGHVVDIATSLDFTIGGQTIPGASWHHHPNWTGNLTAGYDIALIELPVAVTGITPANLYTGATERGKIGTYVGYGRTGTGLTGATTFDGLKRGAQNMLDAFYANAGRILMSDFDNPSTSAWFDNSYGSRTPLHIEGLLAPGDSGGPVFLTAEDGKRYLAGVNSFVGASLFDLNPNSDYGDYSGATRVSIYVNWINQTIAENPPMSITSAGLTGGQGVTAALAVVPEPSVALLLLAATGLVCARRRSA